MMRGPVRRTFSTVRKTQSLVNGAFFTSASDTWYDICDPSTNKVVATVPQSTPEEIQAAIDGAAEAFPAWRDTAVTTRARVMFKLNHLIEEHKDELAALITQENGKTSVDAQGDVHRGREVVEFSTGIATLMMGETVENVSRHIDTISVKQPLGVTASISPFNFPAMVPLWSLPLALASGNTVVMKPSERVPGAALRIAELAMEAGLPPNVLNVVHGKEDTVNAICDSRSIKAISFVGSDAAGKHIHARGTAAGKRVQSNMAAKNHAVILPDADKQSALNALAGAAFGAAGQRCMALSVAVFVGEARRWLPDLVGKARGLKVGHGLSPDSDLGPMISPEALKRAQDLIAEGEQSGATLELDGRGAQVQGYPDGNWLGPTVISGVTTDMQCYKQEIFGPVLNVMFVDTFDEAIQLINENQYGNGGCVLTKSGAAARKFMHEAKVGQMGINIPIPVALPMFSFSGSRGSHLGSYHFYGKQGVDFFTQVKTVTSHWEEGWAADLSTSMVRFD